MKRGLNILLVLIAILSGFACSKTKSYTDRLNDQKDAINRLIDEKGFDILKDYPKDGVFKENEFVSINGIYLQVIDSGVGELAVAGDTKILCRYSGFLPLSEDSTSFNYFIVGSQPLEFTYNVFSQATDDHYLFLSEGLSYPLAHVRDSSIVSIIVPFQVGSTYAQSNYQPYYFERVRYIFKK